MREGEKEQKAFSFIRSGQGFSYTQISMFHACSERELRGSKREKVRNSSVADIGEKRNRI